MQPVAEVKQKTCRECKSKFTPFRPLQVVCSHECAKLWGKKKTENDSAKIAKEQRKKHREAKVKARPLKWYEDRAQRAINAWIVHVRDKDQPCISCGTRNPNIVYAAGHFRTRGAASQLRYNPDNLHKQCNFHCNSQLSGNIQNYRPALIAKIGMERYEALMNNNESRKFSIEELIEINDEYKRKLKELKK